MSKYILLRPAQITAIKNDVKAYMLTTKWGTWIAYVEDKDIREDFEPIRIRDDAQGSRYILPLSVRDNPKFKKLKSLFVSHNAVLVNLTESDFPEYFMDDTQTDYSKPL